MNLQSYVCGGWRSGTGRFDAGCHHGRSHRPSIHRGIDFAPCSPCPRSGRPGASRLDVSRARRALKSVAKRLTEIKEEFYALSYRTGATKSDSMIDIDGGIGTVFVFASKGSRELPNARFSSTAMSRPCRRAHLRRAACVRFARGAAVHINAFNFPVWGMLEKLAPTLLAGMPVIVNGDRDRLLTELVVRRIVE